MWISNYIDFVALTLYCFSEKSFWTVSRAALWTSSIVTVLSI